MTRTLLRIPTLALLALVACGEATGGGPEPETNRFAVSVGVWDPDQRAFTELTEGQPVDIVQGFQGLVFVNLALRAERSIPARFTAEGEIVFEDYDERYPFYDNQVLFEPVGDAWRVVPSFRVPFGLPVSELDGRMVRLDVELTSHDGEWGSSVTRRFELIDGNCVHTPEGEFVCDR